MGNFSQNTGEDTLYSDDRTVVTVQVIRQPSTPMQNIEAIIRNILEHPSLQNADKPELSIRFRATEVELHIDRKGTKADEEPIDGTAES